MNNTASTGMFVPNFASESAIELNQTEYASNEKLDSRNLTWSKARRAPQTGQ